MIWGEERFEFHYETNRLVFIQDYCCARHTITTTRPLCIGKTVRIQHIVCLQWPTFTPEFVFASLSKLGTTSKQARTITLLDKDMAGLLSPIFLTTPELASSSTQISIPSALIYRTEKEQQMMVCILFHYVHPTCSVQSPPICRLADIMLTNPSIPGAKENAMYMTSSEGKKKRGKNSNTRKELVTIRPHNIKDGRLGHEEAFKNRYQCPQEMTRKQTPTQKNNTGGGYRQEQHDNNYISSTLGPGRCRKVNQVRSQEFPSCPLHLYFPHFHNLH